MFLVNNFAQKAYIKLVEIISGIEIYKYPLFVVYNPHKFLVNGSDYAKFTSELKPGDIVLRMYKHKLIQGIIPGFYSHTGLYIGDNTIIHSVKDGVVKTTVYDFSRCDCLAILRPKATEENVAQAIKYANEQIGKAYDYFFDFNNEETYSCTELIYWAYKDVIATYPKEYRRFFGLLKKEIIAPDDLLRDCNCDIIWESSAVDTKIRNLK